MKELSLDQMEQVSGGVVRTINTNTTDKAAIRNGPGKGNKQIAALINGTQVDTVTDQVVYDPVSKRNYVEITFIDKTGATRTGWVAASIVGLPR